MFIWRSITKSGNGALIKILGLSSTMTKVFTSKLESSTQNFSIFHGLMTFFVVFTTTYTPVRFTFTILDHDERTDGDGKPAAAKLACKKICKEMCIVFANKLQFYKIFMRSPRCA